VLFLVTEKGKRKVDSNVDSTRIDARDQHDAFKVRRAALAGWLLVAGCSWTPSRIEPPQIDPESAGNEAITAYDKDGDAALAKEELKSCPALLAALDVYDTSKDGKIQPEEIAARLKSWEDTKVGITAATFYLKLNGRPLTGAQVVLEPEPFLEGAVMPASCETNSSGLAGPTMAPEHLPEGVRFGLQSGLYKIKVTHPSLQIPAKYNEQTELGIEVPPHFDLYHPPIFELRTK
jgi:hypothetical protein